ncbi:hypothetical protein [Burkholderia lata]|uniref:hypothetical protein n=1 Tax=Burkholderia lata (strain ATCC 17760 / DSM 23089 / LMG 22485 / NCIMB 9086 / R18194 / 383) TaxID=482957 RepID=UPI0015830CCD|nr:hypothetical protein [Burkholderia lata]
MQRPDQCGGTDAGYAGSVGTLAPDARRHATDASRPRLARCMNIRIAVLSLFQWFAAATPATSAGHAAVIAASPERSGSRFFQQVQWYENRREMACPILRLFCLNFRICALHTAQRRAMRSPVVQIRMIGLISHRFRQSRARDSPYDVTAVPAHLPGHQQGIAAAHLAPPTPPSAHALWKSTPERRRNSASRPTTILGRRPGRPRPGSLR